MGEIPKTTSGGGVEKPGSERKKEKKRKKKTLKNRKTLVGAGIFGRNAGGGRDFGGGRVASQKSRESPDRAGASVDLDHIRREKKQHKVRCGGRKGVCISEFKRLIILLVVVEDGFSREFEKK